MSTACTACGQSVIWKWDGTGGHMQCYNIDGRTVHWDQCSKNRFRQTKKTGKRFVGRINEHGHLTDGFEDSVHGTKLTRAVAPVIQGKNYQTTGKCRQCVPPWEECVECPDKFV